MILEGIVTTTNADGSANIAPMGPLVEGDLARFVLRPYKTATTYQNLKRHGEGVFHITDDALMIARGAIGLPIDAPTLPAGAVRGVILAGACRYHEFRVVDLDDRDDRTTIRVETVRAGRLRDFFGFNRAKHAVIEAAILATRTQFLPPDQILDEFRRLAVPVEKTGGADEHAAFELLRAHVAGAIAGRGAGPGRAGS